MQLDMAFLERYLPSIDSEHDGTGRAPIVADLGCGTGRVARHLLPRGYRLLNVDLSKPMLQQVRSHSGGLSDSCAIVQANLAELAALRPASLDMAVCLFSSLGMIRGRTNRLRFLDSVRTSLKRDAPFIVHIHNRFRSWSDPGGPAWLLSSKLKSLLKKDCEFGDRVYAYRGLPAMFLHIFSRRELVRDLSHSGFSRIDWFPIHAAANALLPAGCWPMDLRAGGFFFVASSGG